MSDQNRSFRVAFPAGGLVLINLFRTANLSYLYTRLYGVFFGSASLWLGSCLPDDPFLPRMLKR